MDNDQAPRAEQLTVRALRVDDDAGEITRRVHATYARHLGSGLRFWGTRQSVDETRERLASGQALVMTASGRIVGTVVARPPQPTSEVMVYRDPHAWSIAQLAVAPDLRGQGAGRRLHDAAVMAARTAGARRIALDTALPATGLIELYRRWGYRIVGEVDWRPHTNYLSVVMARDVDAHPDGESDPDKTTAP
jgi:ribosomal protein S18 acetylase RimI-like enzyme